MNIKPSLIHSFLCALGIFLLTACSPSAATSIHSSLPQPMQPPTQVPQVPVQYRGDAGRSGVYDLPALRELAGVKWQRGFDEDAYFPIFAGRALYIGTASGKLLALDPGSGEQLWSYDAGDGPILAVAVAGDTIYFGAGDRGFHAVDARTGTLDWLFETDSPVWSSSPLLMNGLAYFGSDRGTVYALDLQTHQPAWTFQGAGGVLWQLTGDGERIYVPTQTVLYALDANTGAKVWSIMTQDKWNAPAVANDTVYIGNGSRQFMALEAETGKERWVFHAPGGQWSEWSAPVIAEDLVYAGYSDKRMYALDRETGEERWHFQAQDWATTDPILAGGVLYFGVGAHARLANDTDDRLFYALDAATGRELWTFEGTGLVYSAATVGNGSLYFKTLDNTLYALH